MNRRIERHPLQPSIFEVIGIRRHSSRKIGQRKQCPSHGHTARIAMPTIEHQLAAHIMSLHLRNPHARGPYRIAVGLENSQSLIQQSHTP